MTDVRMPRTPLGTGPNWVTKAGGLPPILRGVARHLMANGRDESTAIATAVNWAKKMCATGTAFGGRVHVSAAAQAQACEAVARWEAMKGKSLANPCCADCAGTVDLAHEGPYRYRHGWIRLVPGTEGGQRVYTVGGVPHVERTLTMGALQPGDRIGAAASGRVSSAIERVEPHGDGTVTLHMRGRSVAPRFNASERRKVLRPHRGKVIPAGTSLTAAPVTPVDLAGTVTATTDSPTLTIPTMGGRMKGAMPPLPGTSRPRYPINNHTDLKRAIRAVGRAKGDHAKVRRHIIQRARAVGGTHLLPGHWKSDGTTK